MMAGNILWWKKFKRKVWQNSSMFYTATIWEAAHPAVITSMGTWSLLGGVYWGSKCQTVLVSFSGVEVVVEFRDFSP